MQSNARLGLGMHYTCWTDSKAEVSGRFLDERLQIFQPLRSFLTGIRLILSTAAQHQVSARRTLSAPRASSGATHKFMLRSQLRSQLMLLVCAWDHMPTYSHAERF